MNIVYNMDCMEYMRTLPDKEFDLAVVDPPYFSGPERRGYYGSRVSKIGVHRDYPISPEWEIPGVEYFDELNRVAQKIIVWGCNYYKYIFRPDELSGISATGRAASAIARSRRQIAMIASD